MRKLYFLAIICFFSGSISAQTAEPSWTLLKEEAGIRLSYQISTCHDQDWLWFLAENTSSTRKRLEFQLDVLDQGDSGMRKLPITSLVLLPGEVQQITCSVSLPHLRFISIPVKNKELFEIELSSANVITEN